MWLSIKKTDGNTYQQSVVPELLDVLKRCSVARYASEGVACINIQDEALPRNGSPSSHSMDRRALEVQTI